MVPSYWKHDRENTPNELALHSVWIGLSLTLSLLSFLLLSQLCLGECYKNEHTRDFQPPQGISIVNKCRWTHMHSFHWWWEFEHSNGCLSMFKWKKSLLPTFLLSWVSSQDSARGSDEGHKQTVWLSCVCIRDNEFNEIQWKRLIQVMWSCALSL